MEPNWQLARKQDTLIKRARIIQQIRAFFIERDFLEVETPQRIPANAPELHIDAVPSADWFLQTSPELCMKRLLAAGYQRQFQICRCWRAGERGQYHLPEYTMLEWYRSHSDYNQLMTDCESLFLALLPESELRWNNTVVDLTTPWPRMTVAEAFDLYSPVGLDKALETGHFDEIISQQIEPSLPKDKPLFLIDYPMSKASLARRKVNSSVAERVELYVAGLELANGFSELTDQEEQRARFAEEESMRRELGKPPYESPQPFLEELVNMPPSSGIALGIDRLVMLLCNHNNIKEVVTFAPEQL